MRDSLTLATALSLKDFFRMDEDNPEEGNYYAVSFLKGTMTLYVPKEEAKKRYNYIMQQDIFFGDVFFHQKTYLGIERHVDPQYYDILDKTLKFDLLKGYDEDGRPEIEYGKGLDFILSNPSGFTKRNELKYKVSYLSLTPKHMYDKILIPDHIKEPNDLTFGIAYISVIIDGIVR